MKKNVASQSIGAEMITAADGTAFTGSVSVLVTIDNGTQTAGGGTAPAHEGNGYHSYTPTQAETNGDHIAFTFTGTGAIPATVQVYTSFPQTVDNNTILATLPTQTYLDGRTLASAGYFDPATDTVANVTTVATCTTNTDMRGTDSAATAANLAIVDTNVDAILVDTNDLQLNQGNWLTATGFATTAEIADVPTVAEFNARTLPSADYFVVTDYTAPPSAATISTQVWSETTRVLTASTNIVLAKGIGVTGFNDITVSDILTTQMTESYAADGVAPTLTQGLFLTMQNLQDFSFSGATQTVKKIDGTTTAATYTLDDATNPTSKTRAT